MRRLREACELLKVYLEFCSWSLLRAWRSRHGSPSPRSAPAISSDDRTEWVELPGASVRAFDMTPNPDFLRYGEATVLLGVPGDSAETGGGLAAHDSRSEHKMARDLHADGTTEALDAIRSGGDHLVIIARQRIGRALDALDTGKFGEVLKYLSDAEGCVGALSHAQHAIAIADGSRLLAARHLQEGMDITNIGTVTEVDVTECPNQSCRQHINVKIGEHEYEFRGDQEVYVTN